MPGSRFVGEEGKRRLIDSLKSQPILRESPEAAAQLAEVADILSFAKGDHVITQGAFDNDIYFILLGSVGVGPNGRQDSVRKAGGHVGEMAAIDPAATRSANVWCLEPCALAKVSEADFTRVASDYPPIWRHLGKELAARLRERASRVRPRNPIPRLFLASTREALELAEQIRALLQSPELDITIWSEDVFLPGLTNVEALEQQLPVVDFAAVILSPDDQVISRGKSADAPRDNLIFELGLFFGAIGRGRSFMVQPTGVDLKVPTDLLGITPIQYAVLPNVDAQSIADQLKAVIALKGAL